MDEGLVGILIVLIIFGTAALVIKIISDNRIRRRIIESGQVDEKIRYYILNPGKRYLIL